MDEDYLLATARYVELNPLRARLVRKSEAWPWSNARAHLAHRDDALVQAAQLVHNSRMALEPALETREFK